MTVARPVPAAESWRYGSCEVEFVYPDKRLQAAGGMVFADGGSELIQGFERRFGAGRPSDVAVAG